MTPEQARSWAESIGLKLRYDADLPLLAATGAPFTQLTLDEHTADYLSRSQEFRHGTLLTWIHRMMRGFLSDFDINGILGTYPMHVLSTEQWRALLDEHLSSSAHPTKLLDIGAGRGDATAELASLFEHTTVTETSRAMARRLRKQGYTCIEGDISTRDDLFGQFDAVSLLNVLDRCDKPLSLLGTARAALKPGGLLLIALVLPYRPFVYEDGSPRAPLERLPIRSEQWEVATAEFVTLSLAALGLEVLTLSRVPYLSGGDARAPLYELDDLIVVCRAQGEIGLVL